MTSKVLYSILIVLSFGWFYLTNSHLSHFEKEVKSSDDLVKVQHDKDYYFSHNNIYFYNNKVTLERDGEFYQVNHIKPALMFDLSHIFVSTFVFMTLLFLVIHFYRINSFKNIIAMSTSKSDRSTLTLLSENIHHELKTPLIVISKKLQDLQKNEQITNERDYELIHSNVELIYNLLDRMRQFKNNKVSNHSNLHEAANNAFETMQMFQKNNFIFTIDARLKSYNVKDLRSSDIINNLINHIKNSLEASASKIELHFIEYKEDKVFMQLMDNGTGMTKEVQKNVYKENFSTKDTLDLSRGNGMFINKTILNKFGGDDFVISSSPKGTSFGITVPGYKI